MSEEGASADRNGFRDAALEPAREAPMKPERVFLGWQSPLLPSAAAWLIDHGDRNRDHLDLTAFWVVVPGRRAARRLQQLLVESSGGGSGLIPPRVVTLGALPEELYQPDLAVAGAVESRLARLQSLREAEPQQVKRLFADPGRTLDDAGWLDLVDELQRLDRELSAEGHDLASVLQRARALETFPDQDRWTVVWELRRAYESRLRAMRRQSVERARLRAGKGDLPIVRVEHVILAGVLDLPALFRRLIERASSKVSCLVQAPESLASVLDRWGCPATGSSTALESALDLSRVELHIEERPADQVHRAVSITQEWCADAELEPQQISVGFGDARMSRALKEGFELAGLAAHAPADRSVRSSQPAQALVSLASHAGGRRLRDLAGVVRLPVVEDWLEGRGDAPEGGWIEVLDRYSSATAARGLERKTSANATASTTASASSLPGAAELSRLDSYLEELVDISGPAEQRELHAWCPVVVAVLLRLFPAELDLNQSSDRELEWALTEMAQVLQEARNPRAVRRGSSLSFSFSQAVLFFLAALSERALASEPDSDGIELLGWLEVAVDDAPAAVVLGLNEGRIPASVSGDPFLPDSLRSRLGLLDDRKRYCRDLFHLCGLARSKQRLALIAGRQDVEGEPLAPSRLLLTAKGQTLARAVLAFYQREPASPLARKSASPLARKSASPLARKPDSSSARKLALGASSESNRSGFHLPAPEPLESPIERLRATAFRDYLRCPYRFYLRHVLGLQAVRDLPSELDAASFGRLAHEVLRQFALSAAAEYESREEVGTCLRRLLRDCVHYRLGSELLPAARVQLAQLERRFDSFARWQVRQVAEGWTIDRDFIERRCQTHLMVDGEVFEITGTVDRVDRNRDGRLRLLDYKTGETPRSPRAAHGPSKKDGLWSDLQLPLYRRMLLEALDASCDRAHDVGRDPAQDVAQERAPLLELGYVCLSKRLDEEPLRIADWAETELAAAEECARDVIRNLRAERFWPPGEPPRFADEYSWLCGDHLARRYRERTQPAADASGAPGGE